MCARVCDTCLTNSAIAVGSVFAGPPCQSLRFAATMIAEREKERKHEAVGYGGGRGLEGGGGRGEEERIWEKRGRYVDRTGLDGSL